MTSSSNSSASLCSAKMLAPSSVALRRMRRHWTSCRVAESPPPFLGFARLRSLPALSSCLCLGLRLGQSSASATPLFLRLGLRLGQSSAPRFRSASPPSLGPGLRLGQSSALRLHSASPPLGRVKPPLSHPDVAGMASSVYSPALGFASLFSPFGSAPYVPRLLVRAHMQSARGAGLVLYS